MESIIEKTPKTITVRMSTRRWNWLKKIEQTYKRLRANQADRHYRHEALCGIFHTDATQTELVEEYLKEKFDL